MEFQIFDVEKQIKEQRELFRTCFPETIGTPVESLEHYLWKFKSNYGTLRASEHIAMEENKILGYYAAIPFRYKYFGSECTAAMVCDVMTGPKARGKGLFTKLGVYATDKFKEEGFEFSTGFPIRNEVIPGHIKAGWSILFDLPMYGCFISFKSFLSQRKIGFAAPFANVLNSIVRGLMGLFQPKKSSLRLHSFELESNSDIHDIVSFYKKYSNSIPIYLVKDDLFLRWRLSAPHKKYQITLLYDLQEVVGIAVSRDLEKEGIQCLGVLDFALLEGYHKYSKYLTNELVLIGKKMNCELILLMIGQHRAKLFSLSRSLFLRTPYKFSFILKQFGSISDSKDLNKEENWHLSWLDSDDL